MCSSSIKRWTIEFDNSRTFPIPQQGSSFTCIGCDDTNAVGVLRYMVFSFFNQTSTKFYLLPLELTIMDPFTASINRLELDIADKSDKAVLVGFDGELTKLTNNQASEAEHLLVSLHLSTLISSCHDLRVIAWMYNFGFISCRFAEPRRISKRQMISFQSMRERAKQEAVTGKAEEKKEKPVSYVKLEKL